MAQDKPEYQLKAEVINALLAVYSVADATPRLLALGKRHCLERRSQAGRKVVTPLTLEVPLEIALIALTRVSLENFPGEFIALGMLATAEKAGMLPDLEA